MLRVTKLTDYATVVLSTLASQPKQVMSVSELAAHTHLEPPTISKLLKLLSQAGLVEGFRGVQGGYRLSREATEINLFEIVEAIEGPLAMTECSLHQNPCGISNHCQIQGSWRRINDVVADTLRTMSLADMLQLPASRA